MRAGRGRILVCKVSLALERLNKLLLAASMGALILTSCVLTYAVVTRYFFRMPTDWQDDVSVFMLIGVSFLCAADVQARRGHIGIDALSSLLPVAYDRMRRLVVDGASLLFCAFFSWKSWTLLLEAWSEGQTTNSTFAPPLWIPYGMMALGMSLLSVQLLAQLLERALAQRASPVASSDVQELR